MRGWLVQMRFFREGSFREIRLELRTTQEVQVEPPHFDSLCDVGRLWITQELEVKFSYSLNVFGEYAKDQALFPGLGIG